MKTNKYKIKSNQIKEPRTFWPQHALQCLAKGFFLKMGERDVTFPSSGLRCAKSERSSFLLEGVEKCADTRGDYIRTSPWNPKLHLGGGTEE